MTKTPNPFNPEQYQRLENIVSKWQKRIPLNSYEQRLFSNFIKDYSRARWDNHFKNKHRNWGDTQEILDDVPLVVMEYLRVPKPQRVIVGVKQNGKPIFACDLYAEKEYHSLAYKLSIIRRQFPRIISYLQVKHFGYSISTYGSVYYDIQSSISFETHKAFVLMRQLAKEQGIRLYTRQRYELIAQVFFLLNEDKKSQATSTLSSVLAAGNPKVLYRRALVVNLVNDVLATRIQPHNLRTK